MKMILKDSLLEGATRNCFCKSVVFFLFFSVCFGGIFGQTVSITAFQPNASENGPTAGQYTISISNGGFFQNYEILLTVDVTSMADVGDDYVALPASVTMTTSFDGSGNRVVNLNVIDDSIIEPTENVIWNIVPNGTYIVDSGSSSATVTIADNDVAGVNVSTISGNTGEDGTTATFSVSLTSQPSAPVTVALSSNNTAEGIVAGNVTIPIANWNTGVPVTVTGIDDAIVDGNINYTIVTGNVTSADPNYNALGGGAVANVSVTNIDNDTATLTIADITAIEGSSMQFTVTLNTAVANPFTVTVSFQNGTAQGGGPPLIFPEDFNNTSQILNFTGTANETRQFNVPVLNDNVIEQNETFSVQLSASNPGVNDSATATGTITNNDSGTVTVTADRPSTSEAGGQEGRFQIELSEENPLMEDIVVTYVLTGTATQGAGQDYTVSGTVGTAIFENGRDSRNINVDALDDNLVEGDETVVLTITSVSSNAFTVGTPSSATVTILDDDNYVATITASDNAAAETTTGSNTGTFTISLNQPNVSGAGLAVNYAISGTAQNGVDYANLTGSVIIPNNQQTATVTITPTDDLIQEGTEQVTLTLQESPNYDLGGGATQSATVNIADNDQATVSVQDVTVNEDVVGGNLVFTVVLSSAVAGGTNVPYSFINGTATGGGTDFTGTPGTLTFTGTANETRTITVPIINDQLLENSETFTLQLGVPTNGVQRTNGGTAIGTINDDDNCIAAPILDTSVSNIFCDVIDRSLNDFTQSTPPAGNPNVALRWSRNSNPLNENAYLLAAEVANPPNEGSYYGFFLDNNGTPNNFDDDCASGVIEVEIILNTTPTIISAPDSERCGSGTLLLRAEPSDGASINWYTSIDADTPVASGNTFTTPVLNSTRSYFVEATENGCVTERQEVIALVGFQASTGVATNASICNIAANGPTILDLDDRLVGEGAGVWTVTTDPSQSITVPTSNIIDFRNLVAGAYVFTFTTTNSTLPCENVSVDVTISVSDCETDDDGDGLFGGEEATLGTDPADPDTDGDGIDDGTEVGPDVDNPLDEDNDGIIDALDSNILDADNDGVNDQQDPANNNPCLPNRQNGVCDFDGDDIPDSEEIENGSDPDNPCDPNPEHPNCLPIDLQVLKEVDNVDAVIGDTVIFTISLNNLDADREAVEVIVGDLLGMSFEYLSSSPSVGTYSELSGEWFLPEIAPSATETLQITATVTEDGDYSNTAELLASLPIDGNSANNLAMVSLNVDMPEGVDLLITKEARPDEVLIGDELEFVIRVKNISRSDVVRDIEVIDLIETGFEFVSAESDFNGSYDAITGIWSVPELGLDRTATLRIRARAPQLGSFTNTARLIRSAPRDSNPSNNEETVTVEVINRTSADPGFLYNQFSPNGNFENEILRINLEDNDTGLLLGIEYKIEIYDRYGNLVFKGGKAVLPGTQEVVDVWDGTYEGKEAPKGTYFYTLDYKIIDQGVNNAPAILDKGWIQLIR